jgi:hypothetical protein
MKSQLEQHPAFAPARAFVVQFGRETALDTGRIAGRVEHVVSRKAARFQSVDELMACMTEVLREVASRLHHPCCACVARETAWS